MQQDQQIVLSKYEFPFLTSSMFFVLLKFSKLFTKEDQIIAKDSGFMNNCFGISSFGEKFLLENVKAKVLPIKVLKLILYACTCTCTTIFLVGPRCG